MRQTAIETRGLGKHFPGVQALKDVSFQVIEGDVHAIVGENGAGKSTLMKILAGAQAPDQGEVLVRGNPITTFTPDHARSSGISIIYQEFALIPHLTVEQNILLGEEPHRLGWIRSRSLRTQARDALQETGAQLRLRAKLTELSVADRQLVEIAKALSQQTGILIMDEPTAALSLAERESLFGLIRKLRRQGMTILYVSHHLDEVFRISDTISVLKDGQLVSTWPTEAATRERVIRAMVGRSLEQIFPDRTGQPGEVVLHADALRSLPEVREATFSLRRGEIVGIYGLVGSGRTELCQALFGDRPYEGRISVSGHEARIKTTRHAVKSGLALVSEDRKREGLVMNQTLRENLALPSLGQRQRAGVVSPIRESRAIRNMMETLGIRAASSEMLAGQLSGGNQQKAVLGKWLLTSPDVLVCDEPTRGVDVGSKAEIYHQLRRLAKDGLAVLVVSSDLPEVIGLCDRILIMRDGQLTTELPAESATEEQVMTEAISQSTGSETTEGSGKARTSWWQRWGAPLRDRWHRGIPTQAIVFAALAILLIAGAITSPRFFSAYNLTSIVRFAVALGLVSIGQAVAMQAGGVDLSVGAIVTLSTMATATIMSGSNVMILPAVLAAIGVGLAVGAVNGVASVIFRIPPFIATLGVMSVARGVVLLIARGPVGSISRAFRALSRGSLGPIPAAVVILIVAFVIAALLMNRTRYGRHVFALGGNAEVARLSGIRIRSLAFSTFLVSGACSALAGVYLTSRMGMADPSVGPGFELDSIIAVLIGGIPFGGGRGNILGVLLGILLLAVLGNLLNMWNLSSWYSQIARALVLLAAIAIVRKES